MKRSLRKALILPGLLLSALVFGCAGQSSATDGVGKVTMDVDEKGSDSASWKVSKDEVSVRIDRMKRALRYEIDVVVPNGCYSAGDVSEAPAKSRNAVLNVVVEYKPGFCTQAVQTLQFEGQINADAKQIDRVEVNVHDRRTNSVNEISLKL